MSDGITFRYAGAEPTDPDVCLWTTRTLTGEHQSRFLGTVYNLNSDTVLPDQMRAVLDELWPLAGGRKVERLVSGPGFNSSLHLVYRNEGTETLTVPAGTFKTWVLHEMATGVFGSDASINNAYWIDQATGVPVRIRENTNGSVYSAELVFLRLH